MKTITKIVGMFGTMVLVISIIQWFFLYPDISQLLFGAGLGCVILIFAYLYEWMKIVDKQIENLNYRLDDVQYPPREK